MSPRLPGSRPGAAPPRIAAATSEMRTWLPTELLERVDEAARADGVPRAEWVRRAVKQATRTQPRPVSEPYICGKCEVAKRGAERAEGLEAKLARAGEILSSHGCDCDCEHHPEEHEDDCERCLVCRISEVLA